MRRPIPSLLTALATTLVLASVPISAAAEAPAPNPALRPALSPAPSAALAAKVEAGEAAEAVRVGQRQAAVDHLMAQRTQLGLGEGDGFEPLTAFTTRAGKGVVRLAHTYQGHRVWGSQAIVHLGPNGAKTFAQALATGVQLGGAPTLSAQQAINAALARLPPQYQPSRTPSAEVVVFPTSQVEARPFDARFSFPTQHLSLLNHVALAKPYLWAYEVHVSIEQGVDGLLDASFIIDGTTGEALRVWDAAEKLDRSAPVITGPAKGQGRGFYRGTVDLDVSVAADGTYALYDPTRGAGQPNRTMSFFNSWPIDWDTQPIPDLWTPAQWGYSTGILVAPYVTKPGGGVGPWFWQQPSFGKAQPQWGDGLAWEGHMNTLESGGWDAAWGPNGETTAVDTLKTLEDAYDFYQKVLGWTGWDGQDRGIWATTVYGPMNNAYWDSSYLGIFIGGGSLPDVPGWGAMSDLDVVAHEYTHAVSQHVNFWDGAGYEEGGLAEGNSDIMCQMVKAWVNRPQGAPEDVVPEGGIDWIIGAGVGNGSPLRWMIKPSKDGYSLDAWFNGLYQYDPHYQMGVVNRFFYFLAQGASAVAGSDAYSPYLPGGMAGIGNDAAARLWFDTVSTRLPGNGQGTLANTREACLASATAFYGQGSSQYAAVENAWAAVNVGDAHGQPPRTKVSFKEWRDPQTDPLYSLVNLRALQIVPAGEPVAPRATVENNEDTSLAWEVGGRSTAMTYGWLHQRVGGVVASDGRYTIPEGDIQTRWDTGWSASLYLPAYYQLTATSKADSNQFAEGVVYAISVDLDGDGERDALDASGLAFSWQLTSLANVQHSIWLDLNPSSVIVGDLDIALYVDACMNAWRVQ